MPAKTLEVGAISIESILTTVVFRVAGGKPYRLLQLVSFKKRFKLFKLSEL